MRQNEDVFAAWYGDLLKIVTGVMYLEEVELWYTFDAENSVRFAKAIGAPLEGNITEEVAAVFGRGFDSDLFKDCCKQHGITYRYEELIIV